MLQGVYTFEIDELWISVIADEEHVVLVDTGYPDYEDRIVEAMKGAGIDPEKLSHIIITHHDEDHIGSLKALSDRFPKAVILTSEIEKPYLLGEKKAIRLAQADEADNLSPEDKEYFEMVRGIRKVEHVEVVKDGDVLPVCGGIEIIATPGHMPGHISVYVPAQKCLIPGDAVSLSGEGKLFADPTYALDLPESVRSAQKLLQYDIAEVRCYHGGIFRGDGKAALEELIRTQG